jgi:flavin-dependent dehydrogenase
MTDRVDWDAAVVGAGPAGALAARELARRGLAVLLVDRATFPRWKVCGCCLNGNALATLKAVGLGGLTRRCGAVPLEAIRLAARGASADLPLSGVVLSRAAFDAALVEAAISAGATFVPGTRAVLGEETLSGRILHLQRTTESVAITAGVVLAADGLGGLFARSETGATSTVPDSRIGAGVVLGEAPAFFRAGTIYMACGEGGYVGAVRLEDGRLNLAAAMDAKRVRHEGGPGAVTSRLLSQVGWPVPSRLAEQDWKGTPALTRHPRRLASVRVFVLGDAAGYVEPFTGEGMAWALASAVAVAPVAVRAVAEWDPALTRAWAELHSRLVGRRQLVCRVAAAVLRRPLLVRGLVRTLACLPSLARPVVNYLNHRKTTQFPYRPELLPSEYSV